MLYLAPWVTIGGSDRNTVDWFRLLDKRRFRPYLATTQPSPNDLFQEAAQHAEAAWPLPDLMKGEAMPRFVAETVASERIDVVHVMNSRLGFDLLPALKRAFPHLVTVAQLHAEEHPEGTGYPRYVAQRYNGHVDAYSVVSAFLKNRLEGYGVAPEKQHVIRLGVNTAAFDPSRVKPEPIERGGDELHVLFPARLAWQKDPLLMVEVAAHLRDAGAQTIFHVVGDGELRNELQAAVAHRGVEDRVLIHGAALDMPPWYAATDVTLLTSRYEGVPLAIYEAMAMERPVVVADVGGTAEVVDDTVGFLIRDRDDADAYAGALLELESDPGLRRRMGVVARESALAEFPIEAMARRHESLYEALVANAQPKDEARADLTPFDRWWADDTAPLDLCVSTDPPAAFMRVGGDGPPARVSVRVGRVLTRPLLGTQPLRPDGHDVGFVFTSPLPGMVDLHEVLPGHLAGLWASVADGSPPPLDFGFTGSRWVDAPFLLPE